MNAYLDEKALVGMIMDALPGRWYVDTPVAKIRRGNRFYKIRPDAFSPDHKFVVEFDGPQHFQLAASVKRDCEKDAAFIREGYFVLRVPYFIQASPQAFSALAGKRIRVTESAYPHGFIDPKAPRPHTFCPAGVGRYEFILQQLRDSGLCEIANAIEHTEKCASPEWIHVKAACLTLYRQMWRSIYEDPPQIVLTID